MFNIIYMTVKKNVHIRGTEIFELDLLALEFHNLKFLFSNRHTTPEIKKVTFLRSRRLFSHYIAIFIK